MKLFEKHTKAPVLPVRSSQAPEARTSPDLDANRGKKRDARRVRPEQAGRTPHAGKSLLRVRLHRKRVLSERRRRAEAERRRIEAAFAAVWFTDPLVFFS